MHTSCCEKEVLLSIVNHEGIRPAHGNGPHQRCDPWAVFPARCKICCFRNPPARARWLWRHATGTRGWPVQLAARQWKPAGWLTAQHSACCLKTVTRTQRTEEFTAFLSSNPQLLKVVYDSVMLAEFENAFENGMVDKSVISKYIQVFGIFVRWMGHCAAGGSAAHRDAASRWIPRD